MLKAGGVFGTLVDYLILCLAEAYARRCEWSPIGKRVRLEVRSSRDTGLCGRTLFGVISATIPDKTGFTMTKAIVDLDAPLSYFGHYRRDGIKSVRTEPARRWRALDRLLIFPVTVHLVDCDVDEYFARDRVIAFATMYLNRRGRRS